MAASQTSPAPYHAPSSPARPGWAWVALGSNLGDRRAHLARALTWLDVLPRTRVDAVSPVILTAPVGPPQPDYLNAVARLSTALNPLTLLDALLTLERAAGRRRASARLEGPETVRWGPRTLDLDLLLIATHEGPHAQRVIAHPRLQLPHPRLHERAFVLTPLVALDPDLIHPLTGLSMASHLAALKRPRLF